MRTRVRSAYHFMVQRRFLSGNTERCPSTCHQPRHRRCSAAGSGISSWYTILRCHPHSNTAWPTHSGAAVPLVVRVLHASDHSCWYDGAYMRSSCPPDRCSLPDETQDTPNDSAAYQENYAMSGPIGVHKRIRTGLRHFPDAPSAPLV